MTLRPVLGAALLGASLVAVPGVAVAADTEATCDQIATDTTGGPFATDRDSAPLEEMEVDRATERLTAEGRTAGQGVVVAVVDSGVVAPAGMTVTHVDAGNKAPPAYYHGTAVAGLIAGPPRADGKAVGIAPGASILDVQVYDDPAAAPDAQDASPITLPNVVAGLDAVIARMPSMNIKVVTMALALPDSPEVEQRVEQLWSLGAVVVAPTGNRPVEGDDSQTPISSAYDTHLPGEDAAPDVHPANYPHVLGVNSSMTGMPATTDPATYVLENSETDLAAPTANAVSYSVQGGTCLITDPATSWATAEVSGILALQQSVYDESPAQAVARLLATANGRTDVPNTYVGAGEPQALEALTRPLTIAADGTVTSQGTVREQEQQVAAPTTPPDVLASTRKNAVWWGLVGGGALLLALVLRPVLARRRRTVSRL